MMRFFLAHAKDLSYDGGLVLRDAAEKLLRDVARDQPFALILAREEWHTSFERCGGWSEWIAHVVNGTDFASGRPLYDGFVFIGRTIGKATAQIARLALAARRPVVGVEFDRDWRLFDVRRVVTANEKDFKHGWRLE